MISKLSKGEIRLLLAKRSKENIKLLSLTEKCLRDIRGYVFKMPRRGTSVVTGMSGGADSTVTTAILMEDFGLEVYPFFVNRGQRALMYEIKSLNDYSKMFKRKYGSLFNKPVILNIPNPAVEIKKDLTEKLRHDVGHPMRNSIINEYAVQYAFSLENHGKTVRDIFCSVVPSDGDYMYHSTLTALRSQTLHTIIDMGDKSWQIASIPVEREMGYYFDKDFLVKWAYDHNLTLERTRTCVEGSKKHCGICECCYDRKRSFEEACIIDKTEYIDNRKSSEVKLLIESNLKAQKL
jgi:7-cyano-7-deazaguanine synthase